MKSPFLLYQLFLLFFLAQVWIDTDIVLTLIFAEVENFKGAVVFAVGFELTLDSNHPLAGSMDGELAEVCSNPHASQFFGNGGSRARAAEEVGDKVTFVGGCFDDAFKECFRFLGRISNFLLMYMRKFLHDNH